MNIVVDPEDGELVRSQFALMERVHNSARLHAESAELITCDACRVYEKQFAADCLALVELCSMLMAMHFTTVSEIKTPRPGSRFVKVG